MNNVNPATAPKAKVRPQLSIACVLAAAPVKDMTPEGAIALPLAFADEVSSTAAAVLVARDPFVISTTDVREVVSVTERADEAVDVDSCPGNGVPDSPMVALLLGIAFVSELSVATEADVGVSPVFVISTELSTDEKEEETG